jgi:hypothetical protein
MADISTVMSGRCPLSPVGVDAFSVPAIADTCVLGVKGPLLTLSLLTLSLLTLSLVTLSLLTLLEVELLGRELRGCRFWDDDPWVLEDFVRTATLRVIEVPLALRLDCLGFVDSD